MPNWLNRNFGPLLFAAFGLVFGGVGVALLFGSNSTRRQADELAAVPPFTIEQLPVLQPGQPVAVEGRISERNTVAHNSLVLVTAARYDGQDCNNNDNCRQIWTEVERITPAIWLDVPGGRVQLANTDYALYNPPQIWQTTTHLIERQTVEYRGFKMGNPVFVAGAVDNPAGPTLRAEFLFGGTRAEYLASQQNSAGTLLFLGLIFGVFGLLFGGIGAVWAFKP